MYIFVLVCLSVSMHRPIKYMSIWTVASQQMCWIPKDVFSWFQIQKYLNKRWYVFENICVWKAIYVWKIYDMCLKRYIQKYMCLKSDDRTKCLFLTYVFMETYILNDGLYVHTFMHFQGRVRYLHKHDCVEINGFAPETQCGTIRKPMLWNKGTCGHKFQSKI